MAGSCKGICTRYHWKGGNGAGPISYLEGGKRCMTCGGITLKVDGIWCPCCNCRLRTRPRSTVYKRQYVVGVHRFGV